MYTFNYQRPNTLSEAVDAVRNSADGQALAGGMSLLPTLKLRLAQPSDLIDLSAIDELRGIGLQDGQLVIGAMSSHAEVARSPEVRESIPALAELANGIGDAQVRNRGTLGGAIAHNDPAADYPAALVALGAAVHTDRRSIPADEFFTDIFETALEDAELITRVSFPIPDRAAYAKFPNPASRYAIVGVMVAESGGGIRVAVTGAGACVFRVAEMEAALGGNFAADALDGISVPADLLNEDLHASASYRAHLVSVMAKRAVAAASGH